MLACYLKFGNDYSISYTFQQVILLELGTTTQTIALTNLHTLQITKANAKFQSLIDFTGRCLVTASNNGVYSVSVLGSLPVGYCLIPNSWLQQTEFIIIINTNCNWAYARWQCYINNEQYININT
jgi:hypothetical protein